MKKQILKSALMAMVAFFPLTLSTASALTITIDPLNPTGYLPGTLLYDFDTLLPSISVLSGSYQIVAAGTTDTNTAAAPAGDTTAYLSVPLPYSTDPPTLPVDPFATFTFDTDYNYLGFYWGSIDPENTVVFWKDGNTVATVTPFNYPILQPASSDRTSADTNRYVHFSDIVFDQFTLISNRFAFEVDNIAVRPVPEPATMLLFGTGLAGLAALARRRKTQG